MKENLSESDKKEFKKIIDKSEVSTRDIIMKDKDKFLDKFKRIGILKVVDNKVSVDKARLSEILSKEAEQTDLKDVF